MPGTARHFLWKRGNFNVALTIVSPSAWEATLGYPKGSALFPYTSPVLFSILDRSPNAAKERAAFPAPQVRSETGHSASGASGH